MCMALFENCLNWWSLIQMPCKLYPVLIDAFEEYRLACWTILHAILSIVTDTLLWVCRYMKGRIRSLECVSSAFRKGAVCPACPKACKSTLCGCISLVITN